MKSAAITLLAIVLLAAAPVSTGAAIPLWPGPPPGTQTWTQQEKVIRNTPIGTVIFNVANPTITPYLPRRGSATGTGIIVAPGGACVALAWDAEASGIARALQQRGIAAFLLKYRIPEKHGEGIPRNIDMDQACKYGMADGIQAVNVVRSRASEWGVDPHRIGVLGFSAGGMIVSAPLLQADAAARPNFAAFVYGAPFGIMPPIPHALPPVFMAWAQDDPIALQPIVNFYDALRKAGNTPEAHIFSSGGHAFGLKHQGTTSDHWLDEFLVWLKANHF